MPEPQVQLPSLGTRRAQQRLLVAVMPLRSPRPSPAATLADSGQQVQEILTRVLRLRRHALARRCITPRIPGPVLLLQQTPPRSLGGFRRRFPSILAEPLRDNTQGQELLLRPGPRKSLRGMPRLTRKHSGRDLLWEHLLEVCQMPRLDPEGQRLDPGLESLAQTATCADSKLPART